MIGPWVVATMDDGVIYRGIRKAECYEWVENRGAPIIRRRRCGPGDYELLTGYPDEDRSETYYVLTPEAARRNGVDITALANEEDEAYEPRRRFINANEETGVYLGERRDV